MEVIFDLAGDVLIAELLGELDHHAAPEVREDIDSTMVYHEVKNLIMDFTKVTFMDSSGIGVILGRYRKLEKNGGRIVISSCSVTVKNILHMAGVLSIVSCFDSKEEAVKYFEKKEVS